MNYILPHLGLGDYLLVNGLIREIIKPNEDYTLFVNAKYHESIRFMFRDIKNLKYFKIPPIGFNRLTIQPYIIHSIYNLYTIGYENFTGDIPFDQSCYRQFGIDFKKRWSNFYVQRDKDREQKLFYSFGIKNKEYIFLHEGGSEQERYIDRKNLDPELTIVEATPELTKNIFDYCMIIEKASEIHCIESSFFWLCEVIPTIGKLFAYRSDAGKLTQNKNVLPTVKKDWKIL